MMEAIITNAVELIAALLMTLIGVLGTWLTVKVGKRQELQALAVAISEAVGMARMTVDELQQTIVVDLKASREDGKLSKSEITMLSEKLWSMTCEKMSSSAINIIEAANIDLRGLIQGAGEAFISQMKQG